MAYLGGFLLLVATLSFEVGAWHITPDQQLDNELKLAIVALVYLAFGALGIALRRVDHLRTVGRAYLGVFALMTPLVALAAYIFELRSLGVPVAGMLCVAAFYAAAVYLALAGRTGFATYAYFGWTAFLVGALAVVSWANAPGEWSAAALGAVSCVLLLPRAMHRLRGEQAISEPAAASEPAHLTRGDSLHPHPLSRRLGRACLPKYASLRDPGARGGGVSARPACRRLEPDAAHVGARRTSRSV